MRKDETETTNSEVNGPFTSLPMILIHGIHDELSAK